MPKLSEVQGGGKLKLSQVQRPAEKPARATDGMSGVQRFFAGAGKAIADTYEGTKQAVVDSANRHLAIGTSALRAAGADGVADRITRTAGVPVARRLGGMQAEAATRRALDADLMDTGAGLAGNIGAQVGMMAVPLGAATKAGKLANVAGAAGRSAAFAGVQPMTADQNRAGEAVRAGAWGAGGQVAANGLARIGRGASDKIAPHLRQTYERARQAGIPVHASQVSDSKAVKTLASAAAYLPFSGSGKAAARQQEGFNRAVGRSFGEDAPQLTDEVMTSARQRIGGEYDDIYSRNAVTLDDAALSKLGEIEQAARRNLPPNEAQIVANQIEDILAATDNGAMPGQMYQAFRTDRLLPLEGGPRSFQTQQIREIRRVLDDAAERSVGKQDAARLTKARGQYRNLKTAEKALSQVSGSTGDVRPASLWPIVNQKKGASAEMRELARIGQMLKDPIPDSGTAGRLAVYTGLAGLGGGAAMSDSANLSALGQMLLLGATAGRAVNSPLMTRYLVQGNRPIQGLSRRVGPLVWALPATSNATEQDRP